MQHDPLTGNCPVCSTFVLTHVAQRGCKLHCAINGSLTLCDNLVVMPLAHVPNDTRIQFSRLPNCVFFLAHNILWSHAVERIHQQQTASSLAPLLGHKIPATHCMFCWHDLHTDAELPKMLPEIIWKHPHFFASAQQQELDFPQMCHEGQTCGVDVFKGVHSPMEHILRSQENGSVKSDTVDGKRRVTELGHLREATIITHNILKVALVCQALTGILSGFLCSRHMFRFLCWR
mmetsp:Transcript_74029/g.124705  ORF Transcript_74029/g.124705 Transcript_74029/m.124705 type:complete len:233 (+) Transcript_74029:164-862(+)